MLQKNLKNNEANLLLSTHKASFKAIKEALLSIENLDSTLSKPVMIRIEV